MTASGWNAVLIGLLVAAVAFLVRAVIRLARDDRVFRDHLPLAGYSGDGMTHLVWIEELERSGHKVAPRSERFALGEKLDYPMLFHWLVSFLPDRLLRRGEWLMSPMIESIHCLIVFGAALWTIDHVHPDIPPLIPAAAVALGFTLTPLFFKVPERVAVINERVFGLVFANIYLFAVCVLGDGWHWGWFAVAVLAFTIVSCSSKFSIQAVAFLTVGMTLLELSYRPVMILLLSFAFATALSRGYNVTVMRGLIRHSAYYCRTLAQRHVDVMGFSSTVFRDGIVLAARGRILDAWRTIETHPSAWAPVLVPWLIPFIVNLLTEWGSLTDTALASWLTTWAAASILTFVLVTFDSLKFLGEADRYLEFGLFPLVLLSVLPDTEPAWILWGAATLVCLYLLARRFRDSARKPLVGEESRQLVSFMHSLPPVRFIAIPGRLSYPLMHGTDHQAVWWRGNVPDGEAADEWRHMFPPHAIFPYPAPEYVADAIERLGVQAIVIARNDLEMLKGRGLEYDFGEFDRLFENDWFVVMQPKAGRGSAGAPVVRPAD